MRTDAVAQDDATYAGDADSDADNMALNIEMGSLAVSDVAQYAAESALASLEVPNDATHFLTTSDTHM